MTQQKHNGGREPLGRTLYDIAQLLESADGAEERVRRALVLLGKVVPYERCALLEVQSRGEARFVIVPEASPERSAFLRETLTRLLGQIADGPTPPRGAPPGPTGSYLAVPLVGLDHVIGILFVHLADGTYTVAHLRSLSLVAAKLAAYLTLLRARVDQALRPLEMERARVAAEAAIRAKDEFLALASEQLKAPLAAALEGAYVLGSAGASEVERARALAVVIGSLRAQSRLVGDLGDLARIAAAEMRLDRRSVDLASCVRAAIEEQRPAADRGSVRLDSAFDDALRPVHVDSRRLQQVVTSLLENAIRLTPAGGRVEVRLERSGALARIQVTDSGPGIPAELLPRIFDRFGQANGGHARSHDGLGIGLAIVKSLVELHGGRVRAESAGEGKGATFTVELPLFAGPL